MDLGLYQDRPSRNSMNTISKNGRCDDGPACVEVGSIEFDPFIPPKFGPLNIRYQVDDSSSVIPDSMPSKFRNLEVQNNDRDNAGIEGEVEVDSCNIPLSQCV